MATKQDIVNYILDQSASVGILTARKMFGEYAIYCDGKVIALVCDNQLFIKPTKTGKAFIGEVDEASPYPGAKVSFLIPEDRWEDADWLSRLMRLTADELPQPRLKKKK